MQVKTTAPKQYAHDDCRVLHSDYQRLTDRPGTVFGRTLAASNPGVRLKYPVRYPAMSGYVDRWAAVLTPYSSPAGDEAGAYREVPRQVSRAVPHHHPRQGVYERATYCGFKQVQAQDVMLTISACVVGWRREGGNP